MTEDWELDGRKMPDQVLEYLRKIAVRAVEEQGYSPEVVIGVLGYWGIGALGLSRSCLYDWLQRYQTQGLKGLESHPAPGAEAQVTEAMEVWLKETVLHSTPLAHGYDPRLWTRDLLAALLQERFGVQVTGRTISGHLKKLGLGYQKPCYRAVEQDPQEVALFREEKFPRIQRLARKLGADIAFADEAGIGVRTRSGRTWGLVGEPPEIRVTDRRGGYNVLSVVTGQGQMRYSLEAGHINSARYVEFLKQLLKGRTHPLIWLANHASFHGAGKVRAFVRAHRQPLRVFFLPKRSPELNPDDHVWEAVKDKRLGKQPIQNKGDLKKRLRSTLQSLQHRAKRTISFFQLPDTQYAAVDV
jgi:transposase